MFHENNLYHGTHKRFSDDILRNGFKESKGDKEWLGDGIYFYLEDILAFKWAWLKYSKGEIDENTVKNSISIMKVELIKDKIKIFDLDLFEHKLIYERIYKGINKKVLETKLEKGGCAEGIVLNIMFKELNDFLKLNYNIVKATFSIPHKKYKKVIKSEQNKAYKDKTHRLTFVPEIQICVKNKNVIKNIEIYNYNEKIKYFVNLVNNNNNL